MNREAKILEIQKFQKFLKAEMPRILQEIKVYEKAMKEGLIKKNPIYGTHLIKVLLIF